MFSDKPYVKRVRKILEEVIFESRWLLYPFNLGLIFALCVYMMRFAMDVYYFITHSMSAGLEDVVVMLLGLVDGYMVANLIIMIAKGSYQIFIHKFDVEPGQKPQWLDHIDSGLLKVKMSQSIASITGVALLKDFVNIERIPWALVERRLIIHGICLVSALVMAVIWRVTHDSPAPHAPEEAHPGEHAPDNLILPKPTLVPEKAHSKSDHEILVSYKHPLEIPHGLV